LLYYVFIANFTSPAFFPLNFFHQDQDCLKNFTSKKEGPKRPPHTKFLACGFAFCNDWALTIPMPSHLPPANILGFFGGKKNPVFSPPGANETSHALKLFLKLGK
jgi:hypothetical protein